MAEDTGRATVGVAFSTITAEGAPVAVEARVGAIGTAEGFPSADGTVCYWGGLAFSEGGVVTVGSRTYTCSGGAWVVS